MKDCSKTVGDHVVSSIMDLGVEHVFTLPSANIDPLLKCLTSSQVAPILAANELSAGFMADGYARVKGTPGVVMVGGGIASLYVLPAIVNARIEGVPVLLITGDAPEELYQDLPFQSTRQDGTRSEVVFREALGQACCFQLREPQGDWRHVANRLSEGQSAYVSVPYDVQTVPVTYGRPNESAPKNGRESGDLIGVRRVADKLNKARQPIVVLGARIAHLRAKDALIEMLLRRGIRVATSVGALGLIRHDAEGYLGAFGYNGTETARQAVLDPKCDMILLLGGRPGQRDGIGWNAHLSANPELLARVDAPGSAPMKLPTFADLAPDDFAGALDALMAGLVQDAPLDLTNKPGDNSLPDCSPTELLECCIAQTQSHFGSELVAFVDAGLHRGAAIRAWRSNGKNDFHMSAEQAPMGWAIAASIGACFGRQDMRSFCITGDGCMHLLGQEIATAARYGTRNLFLVANNGGLGSIRKRAQTDEEVMVLADRQRVDWVEFAETLGVAGAAAHDAESMQSALGRASATNGPFLIDLHLPLEQRQGLGDPHTIFLGA